MGACGKAPDKTPSATQDSTVQQSGDINFIGGGTQAPESTVDDTYHSPGMKYKPTRTSLNWVSNLDQAVRLIQTDRKKRIIVWFENDKCVECKNIRQTIFSDPDVIAASENWIFVSYNTEINKKESEYMLKEADPPVLIFIGHTGNEYRRRIGTFTKDEFIYMLNNYR